MASTTQSNPAVRSSFRDPGGRLYLGEGRVIRVVNEAGAENARLFLQSPVIQRFTSAGKVIETEIVQTGGLHPALEAGASLLFEHSAVWFPSYPYEWPAEMLAAAAELTLDLAESLLEEGLGLKDATPFNILFRGPNPVFVDALSVERRDPDDPIWRPMAQFQRTFLYPLMAWKYFGLTLAQTLGFRREGPQPEEIARIAGPVRRWLPPFLGMVTIPAFLASRPAVQDPKFYRPRRAAGKGAAEFILRRQFQALRRKVKSLSPSRGHSQWTRYQGADCHYTESDWIAKVEFVRKSIANALPRTVLDVGANMGHFSRIASRLGAQVVAVDSDPVVVGRLWRSAFEAQDNILPLVIDVAAPSPPMGWANRETGGFLERAEGRFNFVLMLAIAHHLLLTSHIAPQELVHQMGRLANNCMIWEHPAPSDPQATLLARGRGNCVRMPGKAEMESLLQETFNQVSQSTLSNARTIYLWENPRDVA